MARWTAPGPFAVTRIEVDERVGGRFRVWHGADGTEAGGFEAEIVELVPDRQIAFRWGFVGPGPRVPGSTPAWWWSSPTVRATPPS